MVYLLKAWYVADNIQSQIQSNSTFHLVHREIVAAAHLKPLDKGDKLQLEGKIVCPWNVTARDQSATIVKQSSAQDQVGHDNCKMI